MPRPDTHCSKLTPNNSGSSKRKTLFTVEDAKAMSKPISKKHEHVKHSFKESVLLPDGDEVEQKTDCDIYAYKINCRSCKDMDVET